MLIHLWKWVGCDFARHRAPSSPTPYIETANEGRGEMDDECAYEVPLYHIPDESGVLGSNVSESDGSPSILPMGRMDPSSVSPCLGQTDPPGSNGSLDWLFDDSNFWCWKLIDCSYMHILEVSKFWNQGSSGSLGWLFDNRNFWHWKLISKLLALYNSYYHFWWQRFIYFNLLLMTEIFDNGNCG